MTLKTILKDFLNHFDYLENQRLQGNDIYENQFKKLKELSEELKHDPEYSISQGECEVNKRKNRYKDILPFDHTRVILSEYPGVPGSDFINGSYVRGASGSLAYIACQGPLPNTLVDFWRMLWECEVQVVVMVCNEKESGKYKCECYWPHEGEKRQYGNITIELVKWRQVCPDFLVRTMKVEFEDKERTICQFHYGTWPDHGVPNSTQPIIELLRLMRDCQPSEALPILIHCSAGCGRTGTLCAIDYVWSLMKFGKLTVSFNLFEIAADMRRQRIAMVQTKDQYILVHKVVAAMFEQQLHVIDSHTYENLDQDGEPLLLKEYQDDPCIYEEVTEYLQNIIKPLEETKNVSKGPMISIRSPNKSDSEEQTQLSWRDSKTLQKLRREESVKRLISGWIQTVEPPNASKSNDELFLSNQENQEEAIYSTINLESPKSSEKLKLSLTEEVVNNKIPGRLIGKATVIRRPSIAKLKALFEKSIGTENDLTRSVSQNPRKVLRGQNNVIVALSHDIIPKSDKGSNLPRQEKSKSNMLSYVSKKLRPPQYMLQKSSEEENYEAVRTPKTLKNKADRSINQDLGEPIYSEICLNQDDLKMDIDQDYSSSSRKKVAKSSKNGEKHSKQMAKQLKQKTPLSLPKFKPNDSLEQVNLPINKVVGNPDQTPAKRPVTLSKLTSCKSKSQPHLELVAPEGCKYLKTSENEEHKRSEQALKSPNVHSQRREVPIPNLNNQVTANKSFDSAASALLKNKEALQKSSSRHETSLQMSHYSNVNALTKKNLAHIDNTIQKCPRGAIIDLTSRKSYVEEYPDVSSPKSPLLEKHLKFSPSKETNDQRTSKFDQNKTSTPLSPKANSKSPRYQKFSSTLSEGSISKDSKRTIYKEPAENAKHYNSEKKSTGLFTVDFLQAIDNQLTKRLQKSSSKSESNQPEQIIDMSKSSDNVYENKTNLPNLQTPKLAQENPYVELKSTARKEISSKRPEEEMRRVFHKREKSLPNFDHIYSTVVKAKEAFRASEGARTSRKDTKPPTSGPTSHNALNSPLLKHSIPGPPKPPRTFNHSPKTPSPCIPHKIPPYNFVQENGGRFMVSIASPRYQAPCTTTNKKAPLTARHSKSSSTSSSNNNKSYTSLIPSLIKSNTEDFNTEQLPHFHKPESNAQKLNSIRSPATTKRLRDVSLYATVRSPPQHSKRPSIFNQPDLYNKGPPKPGYLEESPYGFIKPPSYQETIKARGSKSSSQLRPKAEVSFQDHRRSQDDMDIPACVTNRLEQQIHARRSMVELDSAGIPRNWDDYSDEPPKERVYGSFYCLTRNASNRNIDVEQWTQV